MSSRSRRECVKTWLMRVARKKKRAAEVILGIPAEKNEGK